MYLPKVFDVEIAWDADPALLAWPGDVGSDLGYTGNHFFEDLRGMTWRDAEETYIEEAALLDRITSADNPDAKYQEIMDDTYEDPGALGGLDVGVSSLAVALSAARCIPISSCNAGAFGDAHHEDFPLVALYVRPQAFLPLMQCAIAAGAGFSNGDAGQAIVYDKDILAMMKLARAVIDRHLDFAP